MARWAGKRSVPIGLVIVLLATLGSCLRAAEAGAYGIESFDATLSSLRAGTHPDVTMTVDFDLSDPKAPTNSESVDLELPPGLIANVRNFPTCLLFNFTFPSDPCPQDAQVGVVDLKLDASATYLREPLYLLEGSDNAAVRFGFIGVGVPYILNFDLDPSRSYGATIRAAMLPTGLAVRSVRATVWGVPADPVHDTERLTPLEAIPCEETGTPCLVGGSRPSTYPLEPFMTNPTACGSVTFGVSATAYRLLGEVFTSSATAGEIVGCDEVPFRPTFAAKVASPTAAAPTGLEATLRVPQPEGADTISASALRSAQFTLPPGMTLNLGAADGLGACGAEQVGYRERKAATCPAAAAIGTLELISPLLPRPLEGRIFLRTPGEGGLFGFWLAVDDFGLHIKVPGEFRFGDGGERLTALVSKLPPVPIEALRLQFNSGPRAVLKNPDACGSYSVGYRLEPWSGGAEASGEVPIAVDRSCRDGSYSPDLIAGVTEPTAGSHSPFVLRLVREDGEPDISNVEVTLPPGESADVSAVPVCAEPGAAAVACRSSRVGTVLLAVGSGVHPLWLPQGDRRAGGVYLAGPYRGAPYSLIIGLPAQAGPFDLGTVALRAAVEVNPHTAQLTVTSDPLPRQLGGLAISYRTLDIVLGRPGMMSNPTVCTEKRILGVSESSGGAVAPLSERFQVADCGALGFRPRVGLHLSGGLQAHGHPALHAVLRSVPGQAAVETAAFTLPGSELLDLRHLRELCGHRVPVDRCPGSSRVGSAEVSTPLVGAPLRGPVYLRARRSGLPGVVADLAGGKVRMIVQGRTVAAAGRVGLVLTRLPDVPMARAEFVLSGGRRGLLVNSESLCGSNRAGRATLWSGDGRRKVLGPPLRLRGRC